MKFRDRLSKEHMVEAMKSLRKLQPTVNHSSLLTISALSLILLTAFAIRIFPLRWEIPNGSLHLSEFDPYFQFRFADYVLENGFISWAFPDTPPDLQRWYPNGYLYARNSKPALPLTAAFIYTIVSALGVKIELMDLCAIFPAVTGMLACLFIYFLGKDFGGRPAGLLASLFLALSPSYIQRTAVGFFDTETIGILALVLFTLLFLRSIEKNKPLGSTIGYAVGSGIILGYFVSGWGGALYPIGITVLFTFLAILLKRYTSRLFLSYSLTFGSGLFIAIGVGPPVSYLITGPILAVAAVFFLLCLTEVFRALTSTRAKALSIMILFIVLIGGFSSLWYFGFMRGIAGKFISVLNPMARGGVPLIESVAEHRISAWASIYYEFGIGIIFFLAGFFFAVRDLNNRNLFLIVLGLTSLYFASSMVRLLVLMAPAFALLAAAGTTGILKPFFTLLKETPRITIKRKYSMQHVGREFSGAAVFLIFLVLMTNFAFPTPRVYDQARSPVTVTAGSLPIVPNEPVQEWYNMLDWVNTNLEPATVVCSWWDYGYWLTVMGNVTSLADNATINKTQIQNIGFTFMANETQAIKMLEKYDAKYILVYTTFDVNGRWRNVGDEGKWMWMARISGEAKERFTKKERFTNSSFIDEQDSWTDEKAFGFYNDTRTELYPQGRWQWNLTRPIPTVYKLMAWGKHRWCINTIGAQRDPERLEWSRDNLTEQDIKPKYFKEAYFAGVKLSTEEAKNYGNFVPLICLYEIDWQKYYSDYQET